MEKKPLISVIVPIYMIDRYVGLCIESIIAQTYRNLEIILVDDGSKDRCSELCDLYARKDARIKVIHKTNGGLVSARKAGLQQSNGTYITYVDGDDWIGSDFIQSLYTAMYEYDADIVCAGFSKDIFSKSEPIKEAIPSGVYEGERLLFLQQNMISYGTFYYPGITTYVWNKLFKRSILLEPQNRIDNRITIGEDAAVTYPAIFTSNRVVVIESFSYHYRQREDSMLKTVASYSKDAQQLKYLSDYMMKWANSVPAQYNMPLQVEKYILANAIMRCGGRLPFEDYSFFDKNYYGKKVIIYSAGTFGQQLVNRFKEDRHCDVVAWVDDDFWEYRRCCLDVDPVDSVSDLSFDYVLIAKVSGGEVDSIIERLGNLGVNNDKILTLNIPDDKNNLINHLLDVNRLKLMENKRKVEMASHA